MTAFDDDELEPLGVTCTSTDCENGLHCFRQKERRHPGALRRGGPCRSCGADLVTWQRVNARDINDVGYTFEALRKELIRHEFWHSEFSQQEINHALRKGRAALRDAARKRLETSVGRAKHPLEGRQTPFSGTVILHAQHAVASCCRTCIEYWHAIPAGAALTPAELDYLLELVMLYIAERLPDLPDGPTKVPVKRKRAAAAT
ncbi:DUF4186 family protein [Sorangium sp. So ce233]|uniref:DUF4186 family protein n=1 Tax=Sorangium sp. So ce233 TaxID=3133290 RepID=UPI003F6355B8